MGEGFDRRRVCLVGLIAGGHSGVPRYAARLTQALDDVAGDYPQLTLSLLTTAAGAEAVGARSIAVDVVAGKSRRVNAGPGRLLLEHVLVRRREADLFFRIPFASGDAERPALVCVLVEHQSGPDARMPLRTLLYAVLYWEPVTCAERR